MKVRTTEIHVQVCDTCGYRESQKPASVGMFGSEFSERGADMGPCVQRVANPDDPIPSLCDGRLIADTIIVKAVPKPLMVDEEHVARFVAAQLSNPSLSRHYPHVIVDLATECAKLIAGQERAQQIERDESQKAYDEARAAFIAGEPQAMIEEVASDDR